jgi:hypothetical protein
MMADAGVEVLHSACAADPILQEGLVRGLFVECKSGRRAVKAAVTVDGTGDADIARRAGAPIVPYMPIEKETWGRGRPFLERRKRAVDPRCPTYYNDTQLLCIIAGVDPGRYRRFCDEQPELTAEDKEWARERLSGYPAGLVAALRRAWSDGSYRPDDEVEPAVQMSTARDFSEYPGGLLGFRVTYTGAMDAGDPRQISRLEARARAQAMKTVLFYRERVPGFEHAYLLTCSSFFGMRGGPHIEGEHTLSIKERFDGRKCDDVLYRNIHLGQADHGGEPSGFDVPYGICLPKNVDGLLVCGRGAAYSRRGHDPCAMRARPAMMVFGQAVGTAAAIAAVHRVAPKNLDIKKVQRQLLAEGIALGDGRRLQELGLA